MKIRRTTGSTNSSTRSCRLPRRAGREGAFENGDEDRAYGVVDYDGHPEADRVELRFAGAGRFWRGQQLRPHEPQAEDDQAADEEGEDRGQEGRDCPSCALVDGKTPGGYLDGWGAGPRATRLTSEAKLLS